MKKIDILLVILFFCISNKIIGQVNSRFFYLNEVKDFRVDTTNSGNIYLNGIFKKNFSEKSISTWLINTLKVNTEPQQNIDPYFLTLGITNLKYIEKLNDSKTRISGKFNLKGVFYLHHYSDSTAIFPFIYNVSYNRKPDETEPLLNLLRIKIEDALARTERWFDKNYGVNPDLARRVIITTGDFKPLKPDKDTLYYFERKLNWENFTEKKQSSKYAATVFTNMAYVMNNRISNDTIFINFLTKVVQIKSMSFVQPEFKDKLALNHEQLHFDITQLIAEKYKQRLREETLSPQNLDSRIQFLFLEYFRQINKYQNGYDGDSRHGIDKEEQERWQKKVSDELKVFGIENQ